MIWARPVVAVGKNGGLRESSAERATVDSAQIGPFNCDRQNRMEMVTTARPEPLRPTLRFCHLSESGTVMVTVPV